jgi:hypothetical protein
MHQLRITLEFADPSGATSQVERIVNADAAIASDRADELLEHLANDLDATLRVPGYRAALPTVGDLHSYTARPHPIFAVQELATELNTGAVWLEIHNTYLKTTHFLAVAKSYRDVEPRDCAIRKWYYCHLRKTTALNITVFYLSKIQDLVVRLLHESFGGELISIDPNNPEWERGLSMKGARSGLGRLRAEGTLDAQEYQAILTAIDGPAQGWAEEVVMNYRRCLAHRITPSVDHPELRPALQDRLGVKSYDEHDQVASISWPIGAIPGTPDYSFDELYTAITEYLREQARMLTALKALPRFL